MPRCTSSCTTHAARYRAAGRRLDQPLFEHRGLAFAAEVTQRADERLAGQPLRLVEHVHFTRGDHELLAAEDLDPLLAHLGADVRDAEIVEEPDGRRVVEVTLRVEVAGRGLDVDDEPVPLRAERVGARSRVQAHMNAPPSAMNVWPVR